MDRRDFIKATIAAEIALVTGMSFEACTKKPQKVYDFEDTGKLTLLFICDSHAHLRPMFYREPSVNIGPENMANTAGHLQGEQIFKYWNMGKKPKDVYFLSHLNFEKMAKEWGMMGGYSYIASLANQIRAHRNKENCLFLDVGDTWQGTAVGLWTNGEAIVEAQKILGVDVMTPHWEYTYGKKVLYKNVESLEKSGCKFLAQNVVWDSQNASPDRMADLMDKNNKRVFKPYTIIEKAGIKIGIIGQGFPFTSKAHPVSLKDYNSKDNISLEWSFNISDDKIQLLVNELKSKKVDLIVLQSHNGLEVDKKVASTVKGIDVIVGGHTHDPVPKALEINGKNSSIQKNFAPQELEINGTLLVQAGSHGKFLGRLDLDIKNKKISKYNYKLYPILPKIIKPDPVMEKHIASVHAPYEKKLSEKLATTESLLYRRDSFCGTFDKLIVEAIRDEYGSDVVFSPGFRWGTTILPGDSITLKEVYDHTALTYPDVWTYEYTGEQLIGIWAAILDNLVNPDPYLQLGGDFSRLYGVEMKIKLNIKPSEHPNSRIIDPKIGGKPVDLKKKYIASFWGGQSGQENSLEKYKHRPVYEVVADYLRKKKKVNITTPNYITLV